MPAPWKNLHGPARLIAMCATIMLVASAAGGVEAGIMILLGPARDIVIKPFVLLGYVEFCAIFFSLLGIVCGIFGLIFYRPYRFLSEQIFLYRARHAPLVSDEHTYFEDISRPAPLHHNPEEDGAPD